MQQAGVDTTVIDRFIDLLKQDNIIQDALNQAKVPVAARQFVAQTFQVIASGKPHIIAAVFTFGREDLIPAIFIEMVRGLSAEVHILRYYLERHIEVDGDHHSHLAYEMTAELCGDDPFKWQEATAAALATLKARLALWNAISQKISKS